MSTSSSGFLPESLVDAIKGEVCALQHEGRTRTFLVEFRVEHGTPVEARLRSRESVRIVSLSS